MSIQFIGMIGHRLSSEIIAPQGPVFVVRSAQARKLASLDHLLDGPLALHVISGGSGAEQRKDGDRLDYYQRYSRTDEFLRVIKQVWNNADSFLDYYDLGVTTFLIRGFDLIEDTIEYGRVLLPLTRAKVVQRQKRRAVA